jgi:hypothetical protein
MVLDLCTCFKKNIVPQQLCWSFANLRYQLNFPLLYIHEIEILEALSVYD